MSVETIDWACWAIEEPPADFVDRVIGALPGESRRSAAVRRSSPSRRWMGALAVAVVATGSLTVLAMIGRGDQRQHPSAAEKKRAPGDHALAASAASVAEGSTAGRVVPPAEHAAGTIVDRRLRDAVRARLVRPLEEKGVERDLHTGLVIPAGADGPSHNLSREYLQTRIREDFYPLAMACYQNALAVNPALRGQIVVDFMIVGDSKVGGIVDQAKINDRTDIADAEFTECMRESMLSMVFAPPDKNGWVTVTYPFQFSPDDDDEETSRDR
jgi:hypothetical protein